MQVLCPRINKKQTHSKITSQLSLAEFILIALIYKIFKTIKPSPPPRPQLHSTEVYFLYTWSQTLNMRSKSNILYIHDALLGIALAGKQKIGSRIYAWTGRLHRVI